MIFYCCAHNRDLYFVFVLKFLESYGYFALSQILVIYLHDEFGATDIQAGAIYGMTTVIHV
jgi:dipeptide/tripeptide permease